jgi:hypothetical protein
MDMQDVSMPHNSMNVQGVSPPPAVWTCRVSFRSMDVHQSRAGCILFSTFGQFFVNAGQSGTGMKKIPDAETNPVPECSDKQNEMSEAGVPMPMAASLMPMPSLFPNIEDRLLPCSWYIESGQKSEVCWQGKLLVREGPFFLFPLCSYAGKS